jgi:hypothetical protein
MGSIPGSSTKNLQVKALNLGDTPVECLGGGFDHIGTAFSGDLVTIGDSRSTGGAGRLSSTHLGCLGPVSSD